MDSGRFPAGVVARDSLQIEVVSRESSRIHVFSGFQVLLPRCLHQRPLVVSQRSPTGPPIQTLLVPMRHLPVMSQIQGISRNYSESLRISRNYNSIHGSEQTLITPRVSKRGPTVVRQIQQFRKCKFQWAVF